ncbi:MAG: hypothetical protein HC782_02165 [Gammaproteobacteria bacterium]|nr:hypothetical protein [Gammaproteobacteria bacterium]
MRISGEIGGAYLAIRTYAITPMRYIYYVFGIGKHMREHIKSVMLIQTQIVNLMLGQYLRRPWQDVAKSV